ncbi:histidine phosphatase family protein [Streptomyces sp. NPDC058632]|uniref:histidine phosphatase family protein n=1 Tax=unclassified Streptomyces TaxID=2593676 RepID=UPI00366723C0
MKIYLVRHGQSQWQVSPNRDWDTSLSPLGHNQANHLGQWLADGARIDGNTSLSVGSVVTSPLKRARETAEYLCDPLGLTAHVQHTLTEATFHVVSELPKAASPFAKWRGQLLSDRYLDFRAQARTALEELARRAEETGQPVLAVTHGGLIKTVIRTVAESDKFCLKLYNCGINAIEWTDGRWRVVHINLWDHLPPALRTT